MRKPLKSEIRIETREISDADYPPNQCPKCNSQEFTRGSYYFRDLQELGEPGVVRRIRYESVIWICKNCKTSFSIKHPDIPYRSSYMPSVITYTTTRILQKGDPARRVTNDLKELHNVDISLGTVLSWVNKDGNRKEIPVEFTEGPPLSDFSGVLGVDGTFKSVKAKKNEQRGEGNELPFLHLTHLQDGRLVAYWQEGKTKKKSPPSSKN